jgi:hypothetical protein
MDKKDFTDFGLSKNKIKAQILLGSCKKNDLLNRKVYNGDINNESIPWWFAGCDENSAVFYSVYSLTNELIFSSSKNNYSKSNVIFVLKNLFGKIFSESEKKLFKKSKINTKVEGVQTENHLYLPSGLSGNQFCCVGESDEYKIPGEFYHPNMEKCWLRTPYLEKILCSYFSGGIYGNDVFLTAGLSPAIKIDLNPVLFASTITQKIPIKLEESSEEQPPPESIPESIPAEESTEEQPPPESVPESESIPESVPESESTEEPTEEPTKEPEEEPTKEPEEEPTKEPEERPSSFAFVKEFAEELSENKIISFNDSESNASYVYEFRYKGKNNYGKLKLLEGKVEYENVPENSQLIVIYNNNNEADVLKFDIQGSGVQEVFSQNLPYIYKLWIEHVGTADEMLINDNPAEGLLLAEEIDQNPEFSPEQVPNNPPTNENLKLKIGMILFMSLSFCAFLLFLRKNRKLETYHGMSFY